MVLTKEQYYQRRWFLTILFLILGLGLIYVSYAIFGYNKNENELKVSSATPEIMEIRKKSNYKSIYLQIGSNTISSVIKEKELEKINIILKINNIEPKNYSYILLDKSELQKISLQYSFWKGRLYKLKINNEVIIPFKKRNNSMGYVVLVIGILWTGFQLWALYTLITRGIEIYDESFKDKPRSAKSPDFPRSAKSPDFAEQSKTKRSNNK